MYKELLLRDGLYASYEAYDRRIFENITIAMRQAHVRKAWWIKTQ